MTLTKTQREGLANTAVSTNKIQDSAVTNPKVADNAISTTKVQDSAITTPKLADGSVSFAKIGSIFASISDVVNRVANRLVSGVTLFDWAEDRVPRRVFSANISAGADIRLISVFRAGYNYRIEIDNCQFVGNSDFHMQFSNNNGTTFASGSEDYSFTGTRGSTSLAVTANATSGFIPLAGDTIPASGACVSIHLFNPAGIGKRPRSRSYLQCTSTAVYHSMIYGERLANMAVNAIRIYPVSSTFIAAGTITVYEEKI